ncbi:GTP pyrophosphokinase [Aquitalea magnusonii]|uniref:GTP pyrophosphokinase n=1 Tax=Aquitalea magnusonii TaxID=332411 RepID=UPI000B5C6C3D|nr:hypothetical protein [Aquitalea magnusonii]
MDLNVFRHDLEQKRPQLEAWGRFVQSCILDRLNGLPVSMQITGSRAKEVDSAIGKIARKNYDDPLMQMTDLVGVRFVVLISPQIKVVSEVLESIDSWAFSLDRDWEQEVEVAPETFGYQSRHYVVRSKYALDFDGVTVPANLPCEVQIRTIMQHAYAEMMHDSIYKANGIVPPQAKRFAASSMALIETADHLFCETMRLLDEENRPRKQLWEELVGMYRAKIGDTGFGYDERLNLEILDQCNKYLTPDVATEIQLMVRDRPAIVERIKSRTTSDPFWLQPTAFFAYWLVLKDRRHAFDIWPFSSAHDAMSLVYSDLGMSLGRRY